MLLLSVFLLCFAAIDAFLFPADCLPSASYPTVCCPNYPRNTGSPCGVNEGRGRCVVYSSNPTAPDMNSDDRINLADNYFHTRCQCYGRFTGYDCGKCVPGYTGPQCDRISVRVRKDYREYSPAQQVELLAQLNFCKDQLDPEYLILQAGDRIHSNTYSFTTASYYNVWCFGMYYFSQSFIWQGREQRNINLMRGSTGFLNNNRMGVTKLEIQMQRCLHNDSFVMPYFDYLNNEDCELCTDEHFGASTTKNYLSEFSIFSFWRGICADFSSETTYCVMSNCVCERPRIFRRPGTTPGLRKPNRLDLQRCMAMTNLDSAPYNPSSTNSFRLCIEQMHQAWMDYVGGMMSRPDLACNDPLYALSMVYADKMYDRYISYRGLDSTSYPTDNTNIGHGHADCVAMNFECIPHAYMVTPAATYHTYYSIYVED